MSSFFHFADNDEPEEVGISRRVRHQGPTLKDWDSLGPQQKRKKSQRLMDELRKTSNERNVDPIMMAGSLLHRYFTYFAIVV